MGLQTDFRIDAKTPDALDANHTDYLRRSVFDLDTRTIDSDDFSPDLEVPLFTGARAEIPHEPSRHRVAMLVTHGMGQQVPYETLSAIGQALVTQHDRANPGVSAPTVTVNRVTLTAAEGAPELSRIEVCLETADGSPVDVHVYESYWAPMTEGQISFLQTVEFLYSAAWNGIKTCLSSGYGKKRGRYFDRWVFGDFHEMRIRPATLLMLFLLLASISVLLLPAILLFTPVGLEVGKKIIDLYKGMFLAWSPWKQTITILVMCLGAAFAYWIHYFIVEFAGDVAIYVSSYKVSRFDTIRNNILKEACSVSRQIYAAGITDQHQQQYDSIIIVGHSLGSVISYDLLNAAINWDQVECNFKYGVVDRTTHLITFGSPLDKTAFLFRTQVSSDRNLREALAARQQPLILDYRKFRPRKTFTWTNIYSGMDIISGHLDYYDLQSSPDCNPVRNRKDRQAWIPLLAHTQYWKNEELHKALYETVLNAVATYQPEIRS